MAEGDQSGKKALGGCKRVTTGLREGVDSSKEISCLLTDFFPFPSFPFRVSTQGDVRQ